MADVTALADAIVAALRDGDRTGLETYSARRLDRVWRAQHFSWWMTTMMHADRSGDPYGAQLMRSQLRYVVGSRAAATSLAENYVGLPTEEHRG